MDGKIIKYTLIFLLIFFKASAVEFSGKFIQGYFILGKTDPGSKIIIDKKQVKNDLGYHGGRGPNPRVRT